MLLMAQAQALAGEAATTPVEEPFFDAVTEPCLTVYEEHPLVAVLVLLPVGLAFLLWGYRLYRVLVVLAFLGLGAVLGLMLTPYLAVAPVIPAAIGAVVLGLVAWPLHRMAWGLLGGAVFSTVAAGVATYLAVANPVHLVLVSVGGFILGSVLTVLVMKPLIIVITSLVGALTVGVGTLRLVTLWPAAGEPILRTIDTYAVVPVAVVLGLAAVGSAMQMFGASEKKRKEKEE